MADSGIHIADDNPRYWQYDGEPTLLLGGSSQDNLFQVPGVEHQLDVIANAGGNYVRNTMSARNRRESVLRWGAENVWPFQRVESGEAGATYDLDRFDDAYWERFERFLALTAERDIVVQIEVWASFDYYRGPWDENPFNPANNVNYSAAESGLEETVDTSPTGAAPDTQPFFWSVPAELDLGVVREYQQRFVDRLLAATTEHHHVLYCLDNETSVTPEWSAYWSDYLREHTDERVYVTEMLWEEDASHDQHDATVNDPERYDFLEASQNSKHTGQQHYDIATTFRERATDPARPVNNVKIYGTGDGTQIDFTGSEHDAVERFWRNVFAGHASSRFHRPPYGIGINARAERMLRSARAVIDAVDPVACEPRNDLLSDRKPDEAYALADPGRQYAVYFPRGGSVTLDVAEDSGFDVRWFDVEACQWVDDRPADDQQADDQPVDGSPVRLDAPYRKQWVAVVD